MEVPMNKQSAAAAEFALKAYCIESNPSQFDWEDAIIKQIAGSVDLTEAPEDALSSLVIDLMHYCERERIDWNTDVVSRASQSFSREQGGLVG
jgi:hypothetical protein